MCIRVHQCAIDRTVRAFRTHDVALAAPWPARGRRAMLEVRCAAACVMIQEPCVLALHSAFQL